ncbi:HNH endonuclease [Microvirga brassicacearum]|uniref:HNH endonuclease n=1 Tax=Microvirga brassicacearum TaxID=2580413 RepID=A0A5N3PH19_9HYPH|nr:HNH endonuclease [Microvirga brassicacearum]
MGLQRDKRSKRRRLMKEQDGRCIYCSEPMGEGRQRQTLDHIIPKAEGGTLRNSNIVLACQPCNVDRAQMDAFVYLIRRLMIESCVRRGILVGAKKHRRRQGKIRPRHLGPVGGGLPGNGKRPHQGGHPSEEGPPEEDIEDQDGGGLRVTASPRDGRREEVQPSRDA